MANWMKHTKGLADKPQVRNIARILGITRFETVGRLEHVWDWADEHIEDDDSLPQACAGDIDQIAEMPGMAKAMASAGWLTTTVDGLTLPGFTGHQGATAHQRNLAAQRQAKRRAKDDGHAPVTRLSRVSHAPVTRESRVSHAPVTRDIDEKRRFQPGKGVSRVSHAPRGEERREYKSNSRVRVREEEPKKPTTERRLSWGKMPTYEERQAWADETEVVRVRGDDLYVPYVPRFNRVGRLLNPHEMIPNPDDPDIREHIKHRIQAHPIDRTPPPPRALTPYEKFLEEKEARENRVERVPTPEELAKDKAAQERWLEVLAQPADTPSDTETPE